MVNDLLLGTNSSLTSCRSIPLAYGLILFGFALYKAAEYWKLSSGFKGFHLIGVLIRDQVIYFGL